MPKQKTDFHPIASIFPLMNGDAFEHFKADIKQNGLREPVVLHSDGRILDGRNRYLACEASGVEPEFETWNGKPGDELAFVLSLNLQRRHLDETQRGMVGARMATMAKGANQHSPIGESTTQQSAADLLNVGKRTVERCRNVLDNGTAELIEAADSGLIAAAQAVKIANLSKAKQKKIIKKNTEGTKPTEAMRQVRAEEIESRQIESPTGKYRIIYADPPWSYGNTMPDGTTEQRDHYPVMTIAELCILPVEAMAEDDAVLFIWVTSPILEEAFDVINAWGFKYKASFVWDKVKHNMGHYNSVRHEFFLVCVRGSCQPDVRKLFDSVVTEERMAHSVKPEIFYEIIETIYPNGKRVELFSRKARKGWGAWGYEAKHA